LKRIRSRSALRIAGAALGTAVAAVGLSATSASALNHNSYNILRNAQRGQRCLDMRLEDAPEGARAQLYDCQNPEPDQREFILQTTSPGGGLFYDEIRPRGSRGSGRCLNAGAVEVVRQSVCFNFAQTQSWILNDSTGEITNVYTGYCLTATGDYNLAPVITAPCNGTLAQRWYF
jgi:hypothetical protein